MKEIRKLTDPPLSFEIFDSKSQHLKDLNDEYNDKAQDIDAANKMKWGRVVAMFLGVNKDQTRVIDSNFFEQDILKRLEKNSKASEVFKSFKLTKVEDDLDELLGGSDKSHGTVDLRSIAKKIVNELSDKNGNITRDLTAELQEIHTAIRLGAEATITKGKRDKLSLEPAEVLQETRIGLEGVLTSMLEVSQLKDFNSSKFEFELSMVKTCIFQLSAAFEKLKAK